jgi:hypothetical protein
VYCGRQRPRNERTRWKSSPGIRSPLPGSRPRSDSSPRSGSGRPCLPCGWRHDRTAGPLRSAGATPPPRYSGRLRHSLAVHPFPRDTRYGADHAPPLSRRDEEGFSSCAMRPGPRAVALTPPEWPAAPASLRRSMQPSLSHHGLGLRGFTSFEATCAITPVSARGLAGHPEDGGVDGLQRFGSPPPAIQATGPLALAPTGLIPVERARLRWTHDGRSG